MTTQAQRLFIGGELSADRLLRGGLPGEQTTTKSTFEVKVSDYDNVLRLSLTGITALLHLIAVTVIIFATSSRLAFAAFTATTAALVVVNLAFGVRWTKNRGVPRV